MVESIFPTSNFDVPMREGTAVPMANMMMCEECEHLFDPSDGRAFVSFPYAQCPLCATLRHKTTTAWAVWNGCNGVFEDRVTKDEAEGLLREEYEGVGTCVVPVLVIVAPDDLSFKFGRGQFVTEAERNRLWKEDCQRNQGETTP